MISKYLSRREAAAYLQETYGRPGAIAPSTLAKLAVVGGGPEFVRFGRRVGYAPAALDVFAQARLTPTMKNTSDKSASAA